MTNIQDKMSGHPLKTIKPLLYTASAPFGEIKDI